jgi:hypothetical protein
MSIAGFILRRAAILCAAFLPVAAVAAEKPPQHFTPSGPWAMEYADEGCRLIRKFSDGKTDITLALERFSLEPALRLGLTGESLTMSRLANQIEFRWGDWKPRSSQALSSVLADGRSAYLFPTASLLNEPDPPAAKRKPWPSLPDPGKPLSEQLQTEKDIASGVSVIAITKGFPAPLVLELGRMAGPIEAMQKCVDDLVASWDIDTGRFMAKSRSARPVNDPSYWVTPDDYPPKELSNYGGGVVRVRLVLDADGKIEKCMVEVAVRGPFEQTVCGNIMARAKFAPALDAEGKPFRSYYVQGWNFRAPF